MRSKQQNKFDVPISCGRENICCLTTSHLGYGWLVQWRHFAFTKTGCSHHCLCIIKLHLKRAFLSTIIMVVFGTVVEYFRNAKHFYFPSFIFSFNMLLVTSLITFLHITNRINSDDVLHCCISNYYQ